jgi:hypothetical protein
MLHVCYVTARLSPHLAVVSATSHDVRCFLSWHFQSMLLK